MDCCSGRGRLGTRLGNGRSTLEPIAGKGRGHLTAQAARRPPLVRSRGSGVLTVMRVTGRWVLSFAFVISAQTACHNAVEPTPTPLGYAGEWMGTTTQGTPVRFS